MSPVSARPDHPVSSPPLSLAADSAGPYWAVRPSGAAVALEGPGLEAAGGSFPATGGTKVPVHLIPGSRSVLYRGAANLLHANGNPISGLGSHEWEHFAGADLGDGLIVWAFAAEGTGKAWVYYTGTPGFTPRRLPIVPPGFWAPVCAVSGDHVAMVCRRSGDIETHRVNAAEVRAGQYLDAAKKLHKAPGREGVGTALFFGDPAGAVSTSGGVSWAASLWRRTRKDGKDFSHQLGRVFVDGTEVAQGAAEPAVPGATTAAKLQWTPALCPFSMGLAAAWQSRMPSNQDSGEVTVGLVKGGRVVPGSERMFPGFQPRLAVGGGKLWLGTSEGVWGGGAA